MVSKLVKAITGKPKKIKIQAPEVKPATPLPDEDALKQAAKLDELRRRHTGRSSTLLSDDESDTL